MKGVFKSLAQRFITLLGLEFLGSLGPTIVGTRSLPCCTCAVAIIIIITCTIATTAIRGAGPVPVNVGRALIMQRCQGRR